MQHVVISLFLSSATATAASDFERDVAPILVKRCAGCHHARQASGDLNLTTRPTLLKGGESGPAAVPGKAQESLLLRRVMAGEMPPKQGGKSQALPAAEVETLRSWIAAGAAWPERRVLNPYERTTDSRGGLDWWSLQPVRRPRLPDVPGQRVENPIDAFILAELKKRGLSMAPEAGRRTLIRRVYFDLIGLPPSAEEIEAAQNDPSPEWYERLIDRLLASPQYGERWARYWLDLVRYADTNGYERDAEKPFAWKYRDYVVRSLNADKPYDRFALEQLAGDELPDRSEETVVATGLLRIGTWDDEPNDPVEYKYDRLDDLVNVTGTAFLGLTVRCARCHDHKFDPLPQTDYYRMAGIFWPGYVDPGPRELQGGPDRKTLGVDALGWTDRAASAPPLHLLKKGDPRRPGAEVKPAFLSVVPALDRSFEAPPPDAKSTGRRLQFARQIVDPRNPLTPRVVVNRLWQHHFGEGLVRTPGNFGFKGDRPSHPELLDWLAAELVDDGWSSKRLHRLILTSRTYRQASLHPQEAEYVQKDADNRLLWKMNRRRLDADSLRDAILLVSGRMNPRMTGPGFTPVVSKEALEGLSRKGAAWQPSPPIERDRRSVYLFVKRSLIPPLLTVFDFADTTQPCVQRDRTIVAPQALALLNNEFAHEQSEALAVRVIAGAGHDAGRCVDLAWRLALGRSPTASERNAALSHIRTQARHFAGNGKAERLALASLCHVLLNTNEFAYVD